MVNKNMGLVSRPKGYVDQGPENKDNVVDIFSDSAPTGTAKKVNLDEDAWERTAPPPKGVYSLQLFVGDPVVSINYKKDKTFESYSIKMLAKVVNSTEDYNGAMAFPSVTTRMGRGKSISTAIGLLIKLGYGSKLDPTKEYTDKTIARAVVSALKKEPIIPSNICDWKTSYQDSKEKWQNVANTMDDMPVDENGEHMHIYSITDREGQRRELTAQFYIKEWGGIGAKAVVETPTVVVEEEGEVKEEPKKVEEKPKVNVKIKKSTPPPPLPEPEKEEEESEEEDDELML
jgi:hypothetical protein